MTKRYSIFFSCLLLGLGLASAAYAEDKSYKARTQSPDTERIGFSDEEMSVWESDPVKIECVGIQILDKVSGKVHHAKLTNSITFGTVVISLEKAFKNSPEDMDEVCALIKITENGNELFHNWLFASSPSINRFEHPIYDVRIEFLYDDAK